MENENMEDINVSEVVDNKSKYLDLLDELENDNKLGVMTSLNPDQQLDNDEILRQR